MVIGQKPHLEVQSPGSDRKEQEPVFCARAFRSLALFQEATVPPTTALVHVTPISHRVLLPPKKSPTTALWIFENQANSRPSPPQALQWSPTPLKYQTLHSA